MLELFADLCIIVDKEQGAADQLVGGEERGADATVLDQPQAVQVHVLGCWDKICDKVLKHVIFGLIEKYFKARTLTLLRRLPMKLQRTFETWSFVQVAL